MAIMNCCCGGCDYCIFTNTSKSYEDVTYTAIISGFPSSRIVSFSGIIFNLDDFNASATLEWFSTEYHQDCADYVSYIGHTPDFNGCQYIPSCSDTVLFRVYHYLLFYPLSKVFWYQMALGRYSTSSGTWIRHLELLEIVAITCDIDDSGSVSGSSTRWASEWNYIASTPELVAELSRDPSYATGSAICPCSVSGTTSNETGTLTITVDS